MPEGDDIAAIWKEIAGIRRALDEKEDDAERVHEDLKRQLKVLDRRTKALVIETEDGNGEVKSVARPARIDWKLVVVFLGTVVVPIMVAWLAK